MDIKIAAENTLTLWGKNSSTPIPLPERNEKGLGEAHQHFVLCEIIDGRITGEKAHRWLGWAQGFLVCLGQLSLDDCKYANVLS